MYLLESNTITDDGLKSLTKGIYKTKESALKEVKEYIKTCKLQVFFIEGEIKELYNCEYDYFSYVELYSAQISVQLPKLTEFLTIKKIDYGNITENCILLTGKFYCKYW